MSPRVTLLTHSTALNRTYTISINGLKRVGVIGDTMDNVRTLFGKHDVKVKIDPNTHLSAGSERSVIAPTAMDPLRRSKLRIEGKMLDIPIQDPRVELWSPDIRLVDDDILICIIEVMDLGEAPLDPRYYSRIQNLHRAIPTGATLLGCDSSYVIPDAIEYIAHTMSIEDYPMFPIHTGCGLDLILIREIQGTVESIANAMVSVALDIASTLDEMIGVDPYV